MRSQKFIFLFSFFVFLFIGGLFVFPNDVNANTTAHYTVTGGTDASGGTAVRFTTSDVQKLNISDSEPGNGVDRMRSEKWPDQNQYDENRYIEFIFSPEISENAIISEVKILHEFQRSGALAGVKIEVWDGESFVNIEGSTSGIIGEDHTDVISATAVLNTAQKINNTKIRFLVYRATVTQSGTTTGHDFIGLSVTYALLSPPEQPAEEEDSAEPKESSNSPTYITEDIIENTAWTLAGSPYVIEKNIHVTAGNTLTIEPGVIVKFSPYMSISIYGSLSAEGTSDNNIYFTSLWDDSIGGDTNEDGNATIPNSYSKRGYWRGIHYFSAEGEQSLKNILLSRAQLGLFFNDSDVVIEGLEAISNIIDVSAYNNSSVNVSKLKSKNSFGSVFNDNANLTLDDSIIDNGLSNIYAGVNLSNGGYTTIKGTRISHYSKAGIYDKGGSIVNISNTEISNNFSYGIFVGNNANFSNSQYVVDGLTIKGNTQYSAYNQATSYDIDLRNVYWGTSSGTRLSKGPKDLGNVVSKRILFSPWLLTDPLLSSSEKVITSFSFKNLTPNVDGIINEADHSIILTVPFGTDVKNLIPTVTVSLGASVDPGSNETQDFSSPLIYTVAAEDGSTQEYTVTVVPSCTENCFSNILFIPGFQGSRLYKQKHILLVGDVEDKLWEPNSNSDVADMYMDENGASINRLIYTRDIIEEKKASFFSGGDIYKSFMDDMQAMVADNIISEWRSAPYDWRLSPSQVVERGIIENGTLSYNEDLDTGETSFILKQLEQLAETSKDGKVTIVTHSNGGLVAKALIKKLMEMKASDQGDLIDSVDRLIMVAAPQIGTPKAVAALLHGYGQEIGFGFFLKQKIARKFGINLPGAYSLLPSANYFTRLKGYPVISFDKSIDPLSLNLRGLYGGKIDSFSEFNSFLLDKENNRPNPADNDVLNPAKLNEKILDGAKTLHTDIDADIFPDTMKVYQVAGWGLSTVKNITYYNQRECISSIENKPCTPKNSLSEYVNFTVDGDETVASPSATYVTNSDTENYYLNFDQYIKDTENKKIRHNNIFEMPYLRTLIRNILTDISTIPSYITKEKPKDSKNLIITVPKKIVKIAVKSKIDNKKTGDRPKIQNPDPSN
ncbi:hypothetical protein HYZ82_02670, partial [Candidatus Nomurabacteria bacterium]|nr:hypothetical protein [Candidatus Nomurabacteria bacterium]